MLYAINGKTYDTSINPLTPAPVLEVISPVTLWSDWTKVLTATTSMQSATIKVLSNTWLKFLSIVPSADATANGVAVCVTITVGAGQDTYIPASSQPNLANLINISAIFNITLDPPYGMYLPTGATITISYAATGGSSTLQLVVAGIQQGNANGYPNGVS